MQTSTIVRAVLSLLAAGAVATASAPAQTRDPLKWPFEKYSIWNVPIHNNATYVAAGIQPATYFDPDEDVIIMTPNAPALNVETNTADWSGADRCPDQGATLFSAPIPQNWIYDKTVWRGNTPNSGAAILRSDGSIIQTQPFAKCNTGFATSHYVWTSPCALTGECIQGSHGGSGLSAIGGTIRVGELSAGVIKHVLKLNLFGKENFYHDATGGYRWPATKEDTGYGDPNSANYYGGTNAQMKIGALLAIHKTATLAGLGTGNSLGLETQAGLVIARALQDYGGYTVDNTAWDAYAFVTETGPNGSVATEFKNLYGFDIGVGGLDNSAWGRDLKRIYAGLYVISNNAPGNIGGGPTTDANRRTAFACEFGATGSGYMCGPSSGTPPAAIKIMPLGDSKTEGGGGGNQQSWRGYLRARLMQDGYTIDYVGDRSNVADGDGIPNDNDHAGHGGYTIGPDTQKFCSTCETTGLYEHIQDWLPAANPDVVLLAIGVNDFFNAANHPANYAATAPQRYQDLVNKILQLKPSVKIVLGTIEPVRWDVNWGGPGTELGNLNAKIKQIADASTTDNIYFADIRNRMLVGYGTADFYDDVHLSAQGAAKAANAWYDAVKPVLTPAAAVAVTGVSVSPTAVSLAAGATASLTATVLPANATNKNVSWSSGNTGVATVSATGVVTGVAAGSAVITLTTQDGNKTATSTVTVTATNSGPNLLTTNPGFESGTGVNYANGVYNGITGWVLNNTAYNSIGVSAGGAYRGNNKLQLVYGGRAETVPANRPAVTAGQSYTLRLAIAKVGNTNTGVQSPIYFRINWYNSGGTLLSSTSSGNLLGGGTSAWSVFTVTGTAPANATSAGCYVELLNTPYPNQDAATFHVDEAVLTGAGGNEIKIYAAGKTNTETMQLKVNGNVLQTWTNVGGNAAAGTFAEHTYTSSSSLANAEVHFTNDGGTNDLRIDRITVNGTVYQAENAQSFDAWGGTCNPAGEWLFCNGYKKFTSIPARAAVYEGGRGDARLLVYPVPSRDGTLHVELLNADAPYELRVLDSRGVEVCRAGNVKNKLSLHGASWKGGIYFIKAVTGKEVITRKIVLAK